MNFYHVVFNMCMTLQGSSQYCEAEKIIDTKFTGLVKCYSASKRVEESLVESLKKEAARNNVTLSDLQVKTRCLDFREADSFLEKNGPKSLVVTGKEFD